MVIYSHDIMKVGKVQKSHLFWACWGLYVTGFCPQIYFAFISHKSIIEFISFIYISIFLDKCDIFILDFQPFFYSYLARYPCCLLHDLYFGIGRLLYKILKLSRNRICTSAIFLEWILHISAGKIIGMIYRLRKHFS